MSYQTKTAKEATTQKNNQSSTTCEIDLTSLSIAQVRELKRRCEAILGGVDELNKDDIAISYDCALHTENGITDKFSGVLRLPRARNIKRIGATPGTAEQGFTREVWEPIKDAIFELLQDEVHPSNDVPLIGNPHLEDGSANSWAAAISSISGSGLPLPV